MDIEQAPKLSMCNHGEIAEMVQCGCYFCCEVFDGKEVTEWTDENQTAVCPRCGVDSVLPGVTDTGVLLATHERWFTKEGQPKKGCGCQRGTCESKPIGCRMVEEMKQGSGAQ